MSDSTLAIRNTQAIEVVGGTEVCITRQEGKPLILLVRMASRGLGGWDGVWAGLCGHFSVAQFNLRMPSVEDLANPVQVFKNLARDCDEVARGLGYDEFHILGWAGGAHLALRCAVELPRRLLSCTVLNPFYPLPDMRPVHKGYEFMRTMLQAGGRELYNYYWFMGGLSPGFVRTRFDEVQRMVQVRLEADSFMHGQTGGMSKWSEVLRGFWVEDAELAAIEVPTLVVGSSLDPTFFGPNPDMARLLHSRLRSAELAMAEGYGSLMLMEAPEVFLRLSDNFYSRVVRRAAASN